jgi:hypothetical protein
VSPETLAGVVDFVADAASLRVEPVAATAPPAEEEAYGFFTELEQVVDDAYGFFEPLPELVR